MYLLYTVHWHKYESESIPFTLLIDLWGGSFNFTLPIVFSHFLNDANAREMSRCVCYYLCDLVLRLIIWLFPWHQFLQGCFVCVMTTSRINGVFDFTLVVLLVVLSDIVCFGLGTNPHAPPPPTTTATQSRTTNLMPLNWKLVLCPILFVCYWEQIHQLHQQQQK